MREVAAARRLPGRGLDRGRVPAGRATDDVWRRALGGHRAQPPVTRYGVYVSPDGVAVVVFGRMEVSLDPFPRRFRPGEVCRLRGEVAARYEHARVYLTRPDGKVDETPLSGRPIDVSLPLLRPGVYRVEVMSDGATGPVVLANVPIYVGVDEPAWASAAAAPTTSGPPFPRRRRHACSTLLNEVRRAAGLPPLAADPELRAVAIATPRT